MDSFQIVKSKPLDMAEASAQLSKFIAKEDDAKTDDSEITNTSRARIADDVFTQLHITSVSLEDEVKRAAMKTKLSK